LREHQRHVLIVARETATESAARDRATRADEAGHFGFVRHREAGIEIGLERELAQQREQKASIVLIATSRCGRAVDASARP
jgi:hypothetical protein